jgi:hypothetical protein
MQTGRLSAHFGIDVLVDFLDVQIGNAHLFLEAGDLPFDET